VSDQTQRVGDYRSVLETGLPPAIQLVDLCIVETDAANCSGGTAKPANQASDRHFDVSGPGTLLFARYKVTDRGGGIGKVVVRRNDAAIDGTRKTESESPKERVETVLLPLDAAGDQVTFGTVTANGSIESQADDNIQVAAKPTPKSIAGKPAPDANIVTLYAVAVGVSKYQEADFVLDNAANDAQAIADLLAQPSPPVYDKASVTVLLDQDATAPKIIEALNKIARTAQPQDVVIIFFSGHGETVDGKYYYAPVDFAMRHPDLIDKARHASEADQGAIIDELFRQDGLGEPTLLPIFGKIQGNLLLILDTCFSGTIAADRTVSQKVNEATGARNETAARGVGHETGRSVLAGARAYARDSSGADNHGLFTSFLLRGLNGEADFAHDGRINVADLLRYAKSKVRDESHRLNLDQEPSYYINGSNLFDVRADSTSH
jgi:hypothetical protein